MADDSNCKGVRRRWALFTSRRGFVGVIAVSILILMLVLKQNWEKDCQKLAAHEAPASWGAALYLSEHATVASGVGPVDSFWAPGRVHTALYDQHLSHQAFHGLKGPILEGIVQRLGGKRQTNHTVLICGLEYGQEAELYASAGFRTIVFEPLKDWADQFMKRVSEQIAGHIVMHQVAAAAQRRYGVLEYHGKSETVIFDRLDTYVNEHVSLLALDTQGTEFEILLGAKNLLMQHGVDVLEIEVAMEGRDPPGGPPHVKEMLLMLDQLGYVLFDFAWWGDSNNSTSRLDCLLDAGKEAPLHCYYFGARPTSIPEYINHMHGVQRSTFSWMQTDILAIRRDVLTAELGHFVKKLSDLCKDLDVCALKRLLGEL